MRSVLFTALAGCGFSAALSPPGPKVDAAVDTPPPMIDAMPDAPDAPDARVLAACPVPPANCSRIISACLPETSCYYRCTTNRNWDDAKVRCEQDGMGCLVTINDANENACLALTLDPSMASNRYWIGYRQTDTSNEPLAGWTWPCTGAMSTYTPSPPWGLPPPANEPNDTNGNEDCAMVVNNFGHWIDAACSDQIDSVCEFPR